jgi:hypothetical protein
MNPLFLSHLIADFLLQPKWLVELKMKRTIGTIFHAIIHAAVMVVLLIPTKIETLAAIFVVVIAHGLVDQTKVHFQKKKLPFDLLFFVDQLAHLAIITAVSTLLPYSYSTFWTSQNGKLVWILLFVFSFASAWKNLACLNDCPIKNSRQALLRFATISISFFTFAILAKLFSFPFYSGL